MKYFLLLLFNLKYFFKDKTTDKGRNEDSIYGDIGDYVASDKRNDRREERPRSGYFDKPMEIEKEEGTVVKYNYFIINK